MNKKLPQKLAAKAARVTQLQAENPHTRAHSLGRSAYQLIGGSYGITINPFAVTTFHEANHKEFRLGFNYERKLTRPVIHKDKPAINLRGMLVKVRRAAA